MAGIESEVGTVVQVKEPWRIESSVAPHSTTGLHVVILHSFYRGANPSGENDTVRRQFRIQREAGMNVTLMSLSTDDLVHAGGYRFRAAATTMSGRGFSPVSVLADIDADVVHIHNLFPNIATQWLHSWKSAVVATLHNYRPVCAAGTLSRGDTACTECLDRGSWSAIRHACFHDSRIASVPLAWRTRSGVAGDPVLRRADRLLCPSPMVKQTYARLGLENLELVYQPLEHFPQNAPSRHDRNAGLFIGRLSREKGILALLENWPASEALTIIGDGPLREQAQLLAAERQLNVEFRGYVSARERDAALLSAEYLVFPSTWREGAPAVYAEALASGLPVVALEGNALADMVREDATGSVAARNDESHWASALADVRSALPQVRSRCIGLARQRFTKQGWLSAMNRVYVDAVAKRGR